MLVPGVPVPGGRRNKKDRGVPAGGSHGTYLIAGSEFRQAQLQSGRKTPVVVEVVNQRLPGSVGSVMTAPRAVEQTFPKPLRLWPGVIAVVLGWLVMLFLPLVAPSAARFSLLGGVAGGIGVVVWWLFFSRARWSERLGAVVLMVVATFAVSRLAHASLQAGGGMLVFIYAVPVVALALVAGAAAGRRLAHGPRRAAIVAAILLGCGALALLRIDGVDGSFTADFEWRWSPTAEERLLARVADESAPIRRPRRRRTLLLRRRPLLPCPLTTQLLRPQRTPLPPRGGANRCGVAGISWTAARRRRSRGADRDRLVAVAAGRAVAPPGRAGLVVLRHRRRSLLHPGAAR